MGKGGFGLPFLNPPSLCLVLEEFEGLFTMGLENDPLGAPNNVVRCRDAGWRGRRLVYSRFGFLEIVRLGQRPQC